MISVLLDPFRANENGRFVFDPPYEFDPLSFFAAAILWPPTRSATETPLGFDARFPIAFLDHDDG